jgi:enoyl reductase
MPRLTRRSAFVLVTAGCLLALPSTGTASANETPATGTGGGKKGPTIDATAYSVSYVPAEVPEGQPLTASNGWTPPACWLAPVETPAELKAEREKTWSSESTGYEWDAAQEDYYVKGHPHKDFEQANAGKGMWWNGVVNPNRIADPASLECTEERDEWVLNGEKPPAGPVVTPEILAQSAYDRIRIPDKVVSLSPDAVHAQTVNLNIWAWLDSADIPQVSVTARLKSLGIWATTTAKPVTFSQR